MQRRAFLLGLGLTLALAAPARAQDMVSTITSQLQDQGFRQIDVRRTLLGRTRIVAQSAEGQREIIVNPNTGEILRDLWQPSSSGSRRSPLVDNRRDGGRIGSDDGNRSSNSGSGRDDDRDDDRDDSGNDDDDDDDRSGSSNSGSNSGSGGGDDDDDDDDD